MLRIPTKPESGKGSGYALNLSEFICAECDNEFYVSYDPRETFICPFCAGIAWINGHVRIYAKVELPNKFNEQKIRPEISSEQESLGDS